MIPVALYSTIAIGNLKVNKNWVCIIHECVQ